MKEDSCVLLVDDDPGDLELIKEVIIDYYPGEDVLAFEDPEEAFEYLQNKWQRKNKKWFLLCDLNMPKLSGVDLIKRLRKEEKFNGIPIVVFSSSFEEQDKEECYNAGANSYVVKPGIFPDFKEKIKSIGQYWGEINEPLKTEI